MHFLFGLLSIGAKLTKVQHLEMICTAVPQNTHFHHVGFHEHDSPATPGNVCCMPLRLLQALTNLQPSHLMEDLQCVRQAWQASFGLELIFFCSCLYCTCCTRYGHSSEQYAAERGGLWLMCLSVAQLTFHPGNERLIF